MSHYVLTEARVLGSPQMQRKTSCTPTTSWQTKQVSSGLGASRNITALSPVVLASVISSRTYPAHRCALRPSDHVNLLTDDDSFMSRSRAIRVAMVAKDCCPRSIVRQTYSRRGGIEASDSVACCDDDSSWDSSGPKEADDNDF
jgi:hypothetical protein